jgi:hypothetical protein
MTRMYVRCYRPCIRIVIIFPKCLGKVLNYIEGKCWSILTSKSASSSKFAKMVQDGTRASNSFCIYHYDQVCWHHQCILILTTICRANVLNYIEGIGVFFDRTQQDSSSFNIEKMVQDGTRESTSFFSTTTNVGAITFNVSHN